ncbi:Isochorismatase family protein [Penicillium lividum]|nr:Isochorismatase family protein [Penicillium lividum]
MTGGTTLLLLDIQNGTVEPLMCTEEWLNRLSTVLSTARNNKMNVIHVVTAFRTNYPENHLNNSSVPGVAARGLFQEGDEAVQVHTSVSPAPTEAIVTKRRVSAFFGTDLDMLLRCSNTEHIVVAGLITSGAVLSTVRQAADLDYRVTILRDLCMDRDEEVHRVLMDKVFNRKHTVVTSDEWLSEQKLSK